MIKYSDISSLRVTIRTVIAIALFASASSYGNSIQSFTAPFPGQETGYTAPFPGQDTGRTAPFPGQETGYTAPFPGQCT